MASQRPCLHCSAWLQAFLLCPPMASITDRSRVLKRRSRTVPTQLPPTPQLAPPRGLQRGRVTQGKGSAGGQVPSTVPPSTVPPTLNASRPPNIVWDEFCVAKLVSWIIDHPADRCILYNYQAVSTMSNDKSTVNMKKGIHANIAVDIFEGNEPSLNPRNPAVWYVKFICNWLAAYVDALHANAHPYWLESNLALKLSIRNALEGLNKWEQALTWMVLQITYMVCPFPVFVSSIFWTPGRRNCI